jgi:phosphomannomutase
MVRHALVGGLLGAGCNVVDIGIVPVPTTQLYVRESGAEGGIAITASHNPAEWNALKFIRDDGTFLSPQQGEELLEVYRQGEFTAAGPTALGKLTHDPNALDGHLAALAKHVDAEVIRKARLKVVVDCCNGAGAVAAPRFLADLGCDVTAINATPDGHFPHPPEPIPEHLGDLAQVVAESGADVGFAQDADADRLALVAEGGRALSEEYTLALAARFVAERAEPKGALVTNLSTSRMIEDVGQQFGCPVYRTPVGEINVVEGMRRHRAILGGEGNGGVILPAVQYARDSLVGIGIILEGLARTGRTLADIADRDLPRYHMLKERIECPAREIVRVMTAIRRRYEGERLDESDGVRVEWDDAWLQARPSNTEPIIRLVAEAQEPERAERLVAELREVVEGVLEGA